MTFQVFITNLSKYNEGELVGKWLDLPCDNLEAELASIGVIEGSSYEEYFITDWCNDFLFEGGEFDRLEDLNELAEELLSIEDAWDYEALQAIDEAYGGNLYDAISIYNQGRYTFYRSCDSLVDLAYEIVDECYDLPEVAQRYFDYEAFARDLGFEDYYETAYGVIHLD